MSEKENLIIQSASDVVDVIRKELNTLVKEVEALPDQTEAPATESSTASSGNQTLTADQIKQWFDMKELETNGWANYGKQILVLARLDEQEREEYLRKVHQVAKGDLEEMKPMELKKLLLLDEMFPKHKKAVEKELQEIVKNDVWIKDIVLRLNTDEASFKALEPEWQERMALADLIDRVLPPADGQPGLIESIAKNQSEFLEKAKDWAITAADWGVAGFTGTIALKIGFTLAMKGGLFLAKRPEFQVIKDKVVDGKYALLRKIGVPEEKLKQHKEKQKGRIMKFLGSRTGKVAMIALSAASAYALGVNVTDFNFSDVTAKDLANIPADIANTVANLPDKLINTAVNISESVIAAADELPSPGQVIDSAFANLGSAVSNLPDTARGVVSTGLDSLGVAADTVVAVVDEFMYSSAPTGGVNVPLPLPGDTGFGSAPEFASQMDILSPEAAETPSATVNAESPAAAKAEAPTTPVQPEASAHPGVTAVPVDVAAHAGQTADVYQYTIQKGDALSKIAEAWMQANGVTSYNYADISKAVDVIQAANPQILNPDLIYADATLSMPNSALQQAFTMKMTALTSVDGVVGAAANLTNASANNITPTGGNWYDPSPDRVDRKIEFPGMGINEGG